MGTVLAARAGYDPYGLPAVLQRLAAISPRDSSLAFMFKTHPAPAARLDALDTHLLALEPWAGQESGGGRFRRELGYTR